MRLCRLENPAVFRVARWVNGSINLETRSLQAGPEVTDDVDVKSSIFQQSEQDLFEDLIVNLPRCN